MIYFIRHLNWVIIRLVYNGLSWFGYRCLLVMRAILFCYFMKGTKYSVYDGVSVITLTTPLQFTLAILIVTDTSFRKFKVDREF